MQDKILIIEDDKSILELCRKIFEKNGYIVELTDRPEQGLASLEKTYFHAVLSDIKMPEMDGITLLAKLKEKYPKLPVVMMTADSTVDLAIKALKAGASDYVLKPFDASELISTVSKVIEYSRTKKQVELLSGIISMYEFVNELTKDRTEGELLGFLLWRACKTLNADAGSIFEYNEKTEKMELKASNGGNCAVLDKERIKLLVSRNAPQIILGSDDAKNAYYDISIPIMLKSNLIGVFHLSRTTSSMNSFTEDDKNIAKMFSSHAALIIGRFYSLKEQEEYNALKTEFLSNVSHELRTPLMAISGAMELISGNDGADQNKFLDIIRRNTQRMNNLVIKLLDFNKIENNTIKYSFTKFSAANLLKKAYEDFSSSFNSKNVNLKLVLPDKPPTVYADSERINQVISNLLSNALKFSPAGSTVTLGVKKSAKNVIFFIKDEGIGIDKMYHKKIFNKFFQVDGSTRKETGGFGLGLAIVKSIVDAHHGKIKIQSATGKGATFYIQLPADKND